MFRFCRLRTFVDYEQVRLQINPSRSMDLGGFVFVTQRPSKRLRNLAKARGAIRVKSPLAGCLLYQAIGRNEHGDRVSGGIISLKPGQRSLWSATQMQGDLLFA